MINRDMRHMTDVRQFVLAVLAWRSSTASSPRDRETSTLIIIVGFLPDNSEVNKSLSS